MPAACGSGDGAPAVQQAKAQDGADGGGQSLVGNYLAGRHAQSRRDISAAADFLGAALEKDPGNRDLLHSVFLLSAIEGRIADALGLARRVIERGGDTPIANLVLVVDDMKNGRLDAAGRRLEKTSTTGVNAFMRPLMRAWALVGMERVDEGLLSYPEAWHVGGDMDAHPCLFKPHRAFWLGSNALRLRHGNAQRVGPEAASLVLVLAHDAAAKVPAGGRSNASAAPTQRAPGLIATAWAISDRKHKLSSLWAR